jgi:PAS domain S-box-containing protein
MSRSSKKNAPRTRERRTGFQRREVDRELQLVAQNFPEGALYQYTITPEGARLFTFVGQGFERIFGERPPALPCDIAWLTARIHPEDEPAMAEAGDRSHRELTPFHHEVRIQASDGTERWVSFRSQPRVRADGSVVWDGAVIDVTDRHRAEDEVRRQVEFLSALNQTTLELLGRRQVDDLLRALADRAASLLRSPHAEISLLEGDELVVRAYSTGRDYLAGDRLSRATPALSWRAIDTRAPVVTEAYRDHPDRRDLYITRGVQAAAVFPIVRGAECVGVLGVAREAPGMAFTGEDLREGTLLAQMAALVLDNAAIHEEAVREAETRTRALRESEERFRGVFDKSPIIIALLSVPEGRIVEVNAAAEAAFGYTREEAVGRSSLELGIWVDLSLRERYLARLRAEGAVTAFEAQMRRKNGDIITVLYSGSLITIGGQPFSLNLLHDITARKQSEAARDHSLALMRATLESTADGILVVNATGRIETYNQNFAEMWRLDRVPELPPLGTAHPGATSVPLPVEEQIIRTILASSWSRSASSSACATCIQVPKTRCSTCSSAAMAACSSASRARSSSAAGPRAASGAFATSPTSAAPRPRCARARRSFACSPRCRRRASSAPIPRAARSSSTAAGARSPASRPSRRWARAGWRRCIRRIAAA